MDIGRAFNYVFLDKAWTKKVIIAGLLTFTIIGIPAVIGYVLRIIRGVVGGVDTPLPEWQDLGTLWIEGIKVVPVLIFWFIPSFIIGALQTGDSGLLLACINLVVSAVCTVLSAIAVVKVATSGNLGDGFQVSDVINRLINNFPDYLVVFLMSYVLYIVALLGLVACIVGVIVTSAYAGFVQSHLWAQAFRRSEGDGSLPEAPRF